MQISRVGLCAVAIAVTLSADTREVIRTTVSGHQTISTCYRQGNKTRYESLSDDGRLARVSLEDLDAGSLDTLEMQTKEYTESTRRVPTVLLNMANYIRRPQRTYESGKTVQIYFETVDTQERKTFFGKTASHLLLRERHVAEAGACSQSFEIENDGWYISSRKPGNGYVVIFSNSPMVCHDHVVTHGNAVNPGYPVIETFRRGDSQLTREVLEFSKTPLDSTLFEIPPGFKKMPSPHRTWFVNLQQDYGELTQAVESWFY